MTSCCPRPDEKPRKDPDSWSGDHRSHSHAAWQSAGLSHHNDFPGLRRVNANPPLPVARALAHGELVVGPRIVVLVRPMLDENAMNPRAFIGDTLRSDTGCPLRPTTCAVGSYSWDSWNSYASDRPRPLRSFSNRNLPLGTACWFGGRARGRPVLRAGLPRRTHSPRRQPARLPVGSLRQPSPISTAETTPVRSGRTAQRPSLDHPNPTGRWPDL